MDAKFSCVNALACDLLETFQVINPSSEQIKKAESFIREVICERSITPSEKLTPREKICLQLAAEGKSVREIADFLHISKDTVDTHRRRIMKKLKSKNITEAVYKGMQQAYLWPEENECNIS